MTGTTTHAELPSIGRSLKSLRERKNISVADIASKMHLDSKIITAIEDDNFASLPDSIYVRGYIRSYSKLVGADADEMVRIFQQHGGNFEPEIIPEIRHSSQTTSSDKPVKAFTYLISLGLVVLLIAWWQSNFVIDTPTISPQEIAGIREEQPQSPPAVPLSARPGTSYTTINLQEIPVAPIATEGWANGSLSIDGTLNQNLDPAAVVNNQLPGALPPSIQVNPQTGPTLNTNGLLGVTPGSMTTPSGQPDPLVPAPVAAAPNSDVMLSLSENAYGLTTLPAQNITTANQPTAYQTTGPDLIVLKLTADSWIEIIDANNTKVFFNLGREGDVFNVRGTAPFDVLLGSAQAVTIEFNGGPFNAAPYSRAGVARFKLGE